MAKPREILNHQSINLIISRFALQIIEKQTDEQEPIAIVGLQPRGVELSRRIYARIKEFFPKSTVYYGELDITFHRDDVGRGEILVPKETYLNFNTENKRIILIDDVLYTGRSVRAALDALVAHGRPRQVELMALVDRRYNRELPISPDYVGIAVDSRSTGEKVKVEWSEMDNENKVWLVEHKK